MDIKKDQINKAVEECKNSGADVRYSGAVLKIHDTKKGAAKRILIITNLFITYYKTGSKPLEDRKNYWRNVSSFNYEDNRIELFFDKAPFRFISENSSEIFDIIMEIFLRCFTPDELAPLDLSRFAHPPIKVNGYGILNRNSIILASTDTKQSNSELEELKHFVEYSNPSFEIKESSNCKKATLETIRAAPCLDIVIFSKEQETKKLYKIISNFIHKPSNVHMISLFNRPDENFNQLSKKDKSSNISALKFTDVEMEKEDLIRIRDFIMSANIESLSLCHSLPSIILKSFATDFLESEAISKLSYLCLDGTKKLRINEIIGKLSNISILSLRNCNLEISKVLMHLTKSKIQSLRYLNLSHNKCSFTLQKFRLPPYLERIDLNSIEWKNSTLPQFLTQLFNQDLNDGLKLYINKINISENEWDSVFDTFESLSKYPLVELSWNHNKLSSKFFDFLSNNIQISNLFLNGCFTHTKEEEIIQFSEILPILTNCTHLVIRGDSDTYTIREKVTILYEKIKQMNSISYIDISNNNISTEGVEGLSTLINECNRLTHISFDGSQFDDQKCFEKLIEEGEKRKRPLFIDWPKNDLEILLGTSKINDTNIQAYKDKLLNLSTGISNAKTRAMRNSMQYMSNNVSSLSKSSRMSMRMLKTENIAAQKEKKSKRSRSTVRDIRTGSFRGVKRPNLLIPEKSHMEFDPNSPLNRNFEVYKSYFTHKFPSYLTQNLKNIFACNPIQEQDLSEITFSDEEIEESDFESDLAHDNSSKSAKIKTVEISNDYDNDDEEEEVIELSLLNDPPIPLIDQIPIQKNVRDLDLDKLQSKSPLLKKVLQLPKINKIEKASPLFMINQILSDINNEVDCSSLKINEENNELNEIKSEIKIDDVSDFQSSDDLESDDNLDDIKTYINMIKGEDEV